MWPCLEWCFGVDACCVTVGPTSVAKLNGVTGEDVANARNMLQAAPIMMSVEPTPLMQTMLREESGATGEKLDDGEPAIFPNAHYHGGYSAGPCRTCTYACCPIEGANTMTVASTPAEGQRVEAQWAELRYIDSWPCCPKRKAAVIAFFNHTDAGRVEDTFHVPYASAYCSGMPFRHQMAVYAKHSKLGVVATYMRYVA